MSKLSDIKATTNLELIEQLKRVDTFVPRRTEGRKTYHTEIWSISTLLATLSNYNVIYFPFSLNHRDKPDFLVCSGDLAIGVEVTESIPPKYAEFCALAEREFPDVYLDIGHFRWGTEDITKNEMRAILSNPAITSSGWSGDSAEREWALFIQKSIDTKLAKLVNDEFEKFDQNWLSIYDNLPIPNINLQKAISFLQPLLENNWKCNPRFDSIFIEHGPVIAKISANSSVNLILNDIW